MLIVKQHKSQVLLQQAEGRSCAQDKLFVEYDSKLQQKKPNYGRDGRTGHKLGQWKS